MTDKISPTARFALAACLELEETMGWKDKTLTKRLQTAKNEKRPGALERAVFHRKNMVKGPGFEPGTNGLKTLTGETRQTATECTFHRQNDHIPNQPNTTENDTKLQNIVSGIVSGSDLAELNTNWPALPDHIKAAIMALARTVKP